MKLTDKVEAKCLVYDEETLKGCFLVGFLCLDTDKYVVFEISGRKNDLYSLVKFYNKANIDFVIGYNNIKFDAQVMEFIFDNFEKWHDLTGLEIAAKIYSFVQELIESQNYGIRVPYSESRFHVNQLDCFTILSLENEQRRTSLKGCEFALDMESVEEMPIHHSREDLLEEEIELVCGYMKNDIVATSIVFKLALGITDHLYYQENNQIALRFSIMEEFGIPCLNYSDIQIGEELMKISYAKAVKKQVYELPRRGTFRKTVKVSECIPEYIKFDTPYFQKLLEKVRKTRINQLEKFEEVVKLNGRQYTLAKGGLHADQSNEIYKSREEFIIEDDDVSSYYPKILINNKYFPAHLGEELLKTYTTIYERRISLKAQSKTDKKIKGIVEALKLSLNSVFGKMGSTDSWLFDMKAMFSITLTGELSLLMLIEQFELNGINVISANSDGVTTIFHESKKDLKDKIVSDWQSITNFEIETVRFRSFYYRDVNNYISIKENGEIKEKGVFVVNPEIHKNKSMRVRTLALMEYFINGRSPIEFISNHKNIYDFCIRARATRDSDNYLELNYPDGRVVDVGKLVRYYITKDEDAPELYKKGTGTTGKQMNINQQAPNEIGIRRIKYFNQYEDLKEYNIDYSQYIYETLKIIAGIEGNRKHESYANSLKPTLQTPLF